MILTFLIVVIVGLLISFIVLLNKFQQQKTRFHKKETKLLNTITTVRKKQIYLNQKVKLSEEFNSNYKKSRNVIAENIYEANLELLKNTVEKK